MNKKSPLKQAYPRLYKVYIGMKNRCNNPNNVAYKNYGGRGITVCDEWNQKHGFNSFAKWALNNGYKDTLTIDRIDVNKGYAPGNCRWLSKIDQISSLLNQFKR